MSAALVVALTALLTDGQRGFATPSSSPGSSIELLPSDKNRPANPYVLVSSESLPSLTNKFTGLNDAANGSLNGFAGGESAYSIKLAANKSLWLFGDSLIGKITAGKRSQCTTVRNLIALDNQSKAGSKPTVYERYPAFFKCGNGNFYWPGDGLLLGGKLYIFMHETENRKNHYHGYELNPLTDHLIIVQNPLTEPLKWLVQDYTIGNSGSQKRLGVACLLDGNYLYIYCGNGAFHLGRNSNPTSLARIKKADLQTGKIAQATKEKLPAGALKFDQSKLEWLAEGWHSQCSFLDILWEDGAAEMTVTKLEGLPGYFAFYLPSGNKTIMMRHADQPEGPWSKPLAVYKLPQASTDIVFYSAKAHPEYSPTKGEVALTYCSNSSIPSRVTNDSRLFFPQGVKIKIAPAKK